MSLPLGAVRLTNEFLRHDPARKGELKRLRGFVEREIGRIADRIASARPKNVIATSGTAAALAAIASHLRRGRNRQRMPSRARKWPASPNDWRAFPWPSAGRSKALDRGGLKSSSPALWSITNFWSAALTGFRYSPLGLRDGMLAQMAADYDRSTRSGKHIESERWDSILTAVAHYHVDMKHALDVRDSAMHYFRR